ncbi:sulfur oxidation c-type cytochrome SoxA [Massilia sp. TWR1-2-2]|uniref:sulfur oxidation c-type cytochrome SoxA n=1 Tax=Massilia sp. TWR1-2-2 TaxID=2804584 RepID=UPI003CF5E6C5
MMPARLIALVMLLGAALVHAGDTRKSGAEFINPSTQAMQRDDTQNPAMLWVGGGEALWQRKAGRSDQSCAGCHGNAKVSMRGVAARYPAFDTRTMAALNLGQRVNQCRVNHQQAEPLRAESEELLGIESYIALQSRGMPQAPPADPRLQPARERGQRLFAQRIGQLNLSCAQCHDSNAGNRLGGSTIPQGHALAYPVYRLEWQGMGSLQRRLRNCMSGVRAEVPAFNAQELVDLEVYLAARDKGMKLEAPGVRP